MTMFYLNLCCNMVCYKGTALYMRPNKKTIPVFRVTGPYRSLLVKPRIFSNIILCVLKGEMSFKMYKIIFFPEKKI